MKTTQKYDKLMIKWYIFHSLNKKQCNWIGKDFSWTFPKNASTPDEKFDLDIYWQKVFWNATVNSKNYMFSISKGDR